MKRGRGRPKKSVSEDSKSPAAAAKATPRQVEKLKSPVSDRKTSESDSEQRSSYTGRKRMPNKKYSETDYYQMDYRATKTDESQSESEVDQPKVKSRRGKKQQKQETITPVKSNRDDSSKEAESSADDADGERSLSTTMLPPKKSQIKKFTEEQVDALEGSGQLSPKYVELDGSKSDFNMDANLVKSSSSPTVVVEEEAVLPSDEQQVAISEEVVESSPTKLAVVEDDETNFHGKHTKCRGKLLAKTEPQVVEKLPASYQDAFMKTLSPEKKAIIDENSQQQRENSKYFFL